MNEYQVTTRLMGSIFNLKVVCNTEAQGDYLLNSGVTEIKRIEALLTEFSEDSITSQLNSAAGNYALQVPDEVYEFVVRSLHISRLTQGAFDITVGPLKRLYNFKNGRPLFPGDDSIRDAMKHVGYQHISCLPNNTIALERQGMHISFAAIGKGYAADRVRQIWQAEGVQGGVINASGDLSVLGCNRFGEPWTGGIAHPDAPDTVLLYFPLDNQSMATSGDYVQFFYHNGTRYSHNIDPRTGKPVSGIKSVSVIAGSAELCDALATAVYVMGADVGLHFINQLPGVHCLIVDSSNRIHESYGVQQHYAMASL